MVILFAVSFSNCSIQTGAADHPIKLKTSPGQAKKNIWWKKR
jgi:hypothetical protein